MSAAATRAGPLNVPGLSGRAKQVATHPLCAFLLSQITAAVGKAFSSMEFARATRLSGGVIASTRLLRPAARLSRAASSAVVTVWTSIGARDEFIASRCGPMRADIAGKPHDLIGSRLRMSAIKKTNRLANRSTA
ncbi:hypothetical protein MTO96_019607 [Rhipicephalus appendiculatus]